MPRVVHFEIGAEDSARAGKFYTDVFGWEVRRAQGPVDYWLVTTGPDDEPGINGGILHRRYGSQPVTTTVDVPSVDQYATRVERAGGKIVMPKVPIPGVGWLVYCEDSEGNVFGIMEADGDAK